MQFHRNPPKKMRLDNGNRNNSPTFGDDLWGPDDLTAEEFDMLETQATQSHRQSTLLTPANVSVNHSNVVNNQAELQAMKQSQYALEGRIKILTQSVEKAKKELDEERLNRDKMVKDKVKEFQQHEAELKKEMEKMQSILQFKEQEMKSIYSKIHTLEDQLKEKQETTDIPPKSSSKTFNERFNFGGGTFNSGVNHLPKPGFQRKYKMSLDTPQGITKGVDVISSLLCSHLSISSNQLSFISPINSLPSSVSNTELSVVSVVKLGCEQKTEELINYYENILSTHLLYLENLFSKNNVKNSKLNSPLSTRQKDMDCKQVCVISCLKDLTYLFSCFQTTIDNKRPTDTQSSVFGKTVVRSENVSNSEILDEAQEMDCTESAPAILKHLMTLANPKTYPSGYKTKEEIEWSLSALLAYSYSYPEKLVNHICELPLYSILTADQDVACLCVTLKIMINLINFKQFFALMLHKTGGCLMCAIAAVLLQSVSTVLKVVSALLLVIDLLSAVYSHPSCYEMKIETTQCSSDVLCNFIPLLCRCLELKDKTNTDMRTILKKGINLIHMLSNHLPSFKERRCDVENCYVTLVCGILTLCKEDVEFKDFCDIVHGLWDFQEDISELDLDDLTDEASLTDPDTC